MAAPNPAMFPYVNTQKPADVRRAFLQIASQLQDALNRIQVLEAGGGGGGSAGQWDFSTAVNSGQYLTAGF